MYLTRQADYTMRLLIQLAVQPGETAKIEEIAKQYGISRNHLLKIANRAVQAGYIEGVRGRGGGLRLARKPKDINIGHVLRDVENWNMVECFEPKSKTCVIAGGCGLRAVLKEALAAYLTVLDKYSLADVVHRKALLIQLLGLKVA